MIFLKKISLVIVSSNIKFLELNIQKICSNPAEKNRCKILLREIK